MSAIYLSRTQMFVPVLVAAVLKEAFGETPNWPGILLFSVLLVLIFVAASVLLTISHRKRFEADCMSKLNRVSALRRAAEEDSRAIIETSPAAILTARGDGAIELANEAARRLLLYDPESKPNQHIGEFFPLLVGMLSTHGQPSFVRTMVESRGHRSNGDMFFAHMWLSTYSTPVGPKLAIVVADVSDQVRDREELGLRQLLMNSHIIAGAVSHEVRNLAAAASALHDSVARSCEVADNEDFLALGHLIDGMRKLCSSEIPAASEESLVGVDLNALFKELDIILKSQEDDSIVNFCWEIAEDLPRVRAHRSGLLQVLLNLTQNSRRAVRHTRNACITIAAYPVFESVMVLVADNGRGIATPEQLFQPFQPGASSTGLGLYVSRAIIRTYGGELRYSKRSFESCFQLELPAMTPAEVLASA
jgi:two-component system sensor kinase FixL